ncbi:MAG: hypothetical protein R3E54_02390 [Halioglobus sp.]
MKGDNACAEAEYYHHVGFRLAGSRACLLGLWLLAMTISATIHAQNPRPYYMGFTPWLYDNNAEAINATYDFINGNGEIISHHMEEGVPWSEALANRSYHPNMLWQWDLRKLKTTADAKVFVSISPINQSRNGIADYRGENTHMGLPASFAGKRFNDPDVKKAYLSYAEEVIRFYEPDYLAIAIEANELYFNNRSAWPDFVELYIDTYTTLKLRHPELPVFFTTALHVMNQMRPQTDDAWEELSVLWDYADVAAISYYPHMQYPLDLGNPVAMLDQLRKHTDKPLAVSESGYPAQTIDFPGLDYIPANEQLQAEVLFRFLLVAYRDQYEFVIVWTHRDFDQLMVTTNMPAYGALWRDTGLISETGRKRFAGEVWDVFLQLPMN